MLAFVVSVLVRSGLILGTALLVRRFGRLGPSDRHRVLLAGLALCLFWPLCSAMIPAVAIPAPSLRSIVFKQVVFVTDRAVADRHVAVSLLGIWVAGMAFVFARIIVGHLYVRKVVRGASPLRHLPSSPRVLISAKPIVPFTYGIFRSAIVLPRECKAWFPMRTQTVLLHEQAHIRRRDVLAQLFASLVSAVWWFQPLVWWASAALRRESEQACDAAVLASGIAASDYARELLEVAQAFSGLRACSTVIAMARNSDLEGRLNAIVTPQKPLLRGVCFATACALTAVTLTASAVTLSTDQINLPGAHIMKRSLFSGLLASAAGVSALTIGAAAFHSSGHATAASAATTLNTEPSDPLRVPGAFEQAKLVTKVQPVYPAAAKAAEVQGTVELEAVISKEGVPEQIHVIASPSDELTHSALDAVWQWRYSPTWLNGQPVDVVTEIIVNYTLAK